MTKPADAAHLLTTLNSVQRDIVRTLTVRPRNGQEIKRQLDDYYPSPPSDSRLYENLDSLVDEGVIEKHVPERGRANLYTLTEVGECALSGHQEWLNQLGEEDETHA